MENKEKKKKDFEELDEKYLMIDCPDHLFKGHNLDINKVRCYLIEYHGLGESQQIKLFKETYGRNRYDFHEEQNQLLDGEQYKGLKGTFPLSIFETLN